MSPDLFSLGSDLKSSESSKNTDSEVKLQTLLTLLCEASEEQGMEKSKKEKKNETLTMAFLKNPNQSLVV